MMTQVKTVSPPTSVNFSQALNAEFKSSQSLELKSFCQLQVENLTAQHPIFWAQIVYYDPLLSGRQRVSDRSSQNSPSRAILADLSSEEWLVDFPPAFTVNELDLENSASSCYICPFGYRNQNPEYILLLTREPLSPNQKQVIRQSAMLLSKYSDIHLQCGQQQAEIQLLEHVIHRAGHQLRNPLSSIGLYAENLHLGLPSGPWQEQAAVIREAIQELDTNLNELIYCGQGTKLRVTLQDLRTLLTESIRGLQPAIEQKQLRISYPEFSTTLAVDRLQMKQVFDNLLSNAIHFSPHSETINCSWQIFQNEVLICISDRGPGLSSEDLKKIFTPFYSRRSGGTGLGLTIAKKIILDHQGSLWAQNLSQQGAQFCLSLPRPMTSEKKGCSL
jgi:signal transduction histidine kinase